MPKTRVKSLFSKDYDLFRQLLLQARIEAGISQQELCKALKRPHSFVSKYETGERRLDVVEFIQIARVIKFDPSQFIRTLDNLTCSPHSRNFKKPSSSASSS